MSLNADKSFKMKMREMETAFRYRRFPYPKRSVELIALVAISCTFFLFMHTNKLNSRLKEMEMKLQPSEFSALGLTGSNHLDSSKHGDINTLHGTYQYLKSTGQLFNLNADLLNNTKKSLPDILFFNRVPKTGSLQMITLMRQLGKLHDYVVEVDPNIGGIRSSLDGQEEEDMIDSILNFSEGVAFVSHMNHLNFTAYGQPLPIYINMVRDPVERVISWYYYLRSPWIFVPGRRKNNREMPDPKWVNTEFDQCVLSKEPACTFIEGAGLEKVHDHRRQTLFFCGNNIENCMPFNTQLPLELAKRSVEQDYAVVGTWEDTNITLSVLENYIPRYFKGATKMYYSGLNTNIQNSNPFKPHISEELKQSLRKNFTREIEFYQFCRQRLHKQYLALKRNDLKALEEKEKLKNLTFFKKALLKLK